MANYLLAYHGGLVAPTEDARNKSMAAWRKWISDLGPAVVDAGNPIVKTKRLSSKGAVDGGGADALSGYSVIKADSIDAAIAKANSCPLIAEGGTIDVCETVQM